MKIAILHEMLIKLGGAEKVVESILKKYPEADLFTLIYDEKKVGNVFSKSQIHTQCSKLTSQRIYNITKKQRFCLPFMSSSVESLDFSDYDQVIVSSSGFAHGLQTPPKCKTIIYYHAPARYMWDWTHEYLKEIRFNTGIKGFLFGKLLLKLRLWDYGVAQNNDTLLANSKNTQKRIQKYFRRDSHVLYPPVETERFAKKTSHNFQNTFFKKEYYIILSALTEFKRLDVAIQAFSQMPDINLLIIGNGDYKGELKNLCGGSKNIVFAGAQFGDQLVSLVQNSLGLIFPGEEDFGIVPIEIMAAGKPVFALNEGGLTETVIAGKTGDFFNNKQGDDFIEKFEIFHQNNTVGKYTPENCKKQAGKYSEESFHAELRTYLS